jgi:hypothetical protein
VTANGKRPPTEAALLLLGMQRGLFGLQFFNQRIDPIDRQLITDRRAYPSIVLSLFVDLDTLGTHGLFRLLKGDQPKESRFVQSATWAAVDRAMIATD